MKHSKDLKKYNMNILFRADSSSTIGTGHIMRDLVLASQYKDSNITFATRDLKGNINNKISESGYKIKILKSNKADELDALIKKLKIDTLVIDNYSIDHKFEKKLKDNNQKLKIISLDDTYEKHYCDILLNHNIYANKKKYKGLVPKQCELRCGAKYTLLRDEFIKEKKRLKRKNETKKKKTVFIAMGGADTNNINIPILKVLKKFKHLKVNLVTTTANKHLQELKKYCKDKVWINLHINSNEIAKLMRKSDLAIVTPSVTVNEVYYMRLSLIAIMTAENQLEMYKYLKKNNYPVLKKFNNNKLLNKLQSLGLK